MLPASRRKPPALNICLRSAFGKNQIRSRPSYHGWGIRIPALDTDVPRSSPPLQGPPSCWVVQVIDRVPISCKAGLLLGSPIFCRVPNPFLPEAQGTSVEKRYWLAPLSCIPTTASLSFPFLYQENGHACPPQSVAMRMNSSNSYCPVECQLRQTCFLVP